MFALLFLVFGVLILLAIAGGIWIDASPIGSRTITTAAENPGKSVPTVV
jgi:hypothetical protein